MSYISGLAALPKWNYNVTPGKLQISRCPSCKHNIEIPLHLTGHT